MKTMKFIMILLALVVSIPASATITHRFDFAADANDVVAGLKGTLIGNAALADGSLVLDGTDDWMEMPGSSIAVNTYTGVSMEMWYTPVSGGNTSWSMLAYLGGNNPAATWMGVNYFFMTSARNDNFSRAAISVGNDVDPWVDESGVNGTEYDDGLQHHMVATVDGANISLFIDGLLIGSVPLADETISGLSNDRAYLGKGGYMDDPEWRGSIQEFRIYNKALNAAEVAFTNHFGEDDPKPIVIRTNTPAYGTTLVPTQPALSWTVEPSITPDSYNLYLGTDPNIIDPNRPDVSGISDFVATGLVSASYAPTSALQNNKNYYWRVDCVVGTTTYQGAGSMFTTVPASPVFSVNPGTLGVFTGETAVFTAACSSISPLNGAVKWFKAGTAGDTQIMTGISETSDGELTTSTLTITGAAIANEGQYYAQATNEGGTVKSANGTLLVKRLLAQYQFEGNADDSSGSGLHGSIKTPNGTAATATYVTSTLAGMGQAISFTGTGSSNTTNTVDPYVDLPDGFDNFTQGLTISAWIYPTAAANWARIAQFGNGTNAANNSLYFTRVGTGSTLRFQNDNTNPTNGTSVTTGNNGLTLNAWQHVVIAVNTDATNNAVIYRNGLPAATGTITLPNVVTRTNCFIGRSEWYGDLLYRGQMDDFRVYNYGLGATDVAKLYSDVAGPFCLTKPVYDLNNDCLINLADFAVFASDWLECGRYPKVCP